jgi:hypothetical protein
LEVSRIIFRAPATPTKENHVANYTLVISVPECAEEFGIFGGRIWRGTKDSNRSKFYATTPSREYETEVGKRERFEFLRPVDARKQDGFTKIREWIAARFEDSEIGRELSRRSVA